MSVPVVDSDFCKATATIPDPVWVWGVPLTPVTMAQTLDTADRLVAGRTPSLIITPNLNFAMLASKQPDLSGLCQRAALSLADGMPLILASRWKAKRLPERVTGSDLIFRISERAAEKGHRVFFLGGADGVAQAAVQNLQTRFPGLTVVGYENPILSKLSPEELESLFQRVRAAQPDILIAALSQPSGERWLTTHLESLGVPVCAQFGAAIDFAAGRVQRAPRWMQKTCLEWVYRILQEPRRLAPRYFQNLTFITRMLMRDFIDIVRGRTEQAPRNSTAS